MATAAKGEGVLGNASQQQTSEHEQAQPSHAQTNSQEGEEEEGNESDPEDGADDNNNNNNNNNNDEDNEDDSRPRSASPPLPQRHTAASPGPRASRLQDLYAQSLRHTLGKVGYGNFAGCFPTVARGADGVLRQVHGQMVEKLGEKLGKEFENIMAVRQVVPKLNELESLIGDASHRRTTAPDSVPTPPHLLPAASILAAHRHPTLAHHQSRLNARLQTSQGRNGQLAGEIQAQRDEVARLVAGLEATLRDVGEANEVLGRVVREDYSGGGGEDALAREARAAARDVEMR